MSARLRTLSWPRRPGVGSSRGHLAGCGRILREALPQSERCNGATPLRSEPLKAVQGGSTATFTTTVVSAAGVLECYGATITVAILWHYYGNTMAVLSGECLNGGT